MEKFTKSPWVIGATTDNAPFCVDAKCNNDGVTFEVCSVWGSNVDTEPCEQSQANASLIAAAPEMYQELIDAKTGFEFIIENSLVNAIYLPALHQQVESINSILAKARGGK